MAANRIKGIIIEIGGDTTKWQTVSKGVNTEVKNTQQQPRDELCHFVHSNHSKEYYGFLGSLMPDWRERKVCLEK